MINLIQNAFKFKDRIAIKSDGNNYTYEQLLVASERIALALLNGRIDLKEERIAFIVPSGIHYVAIQWLSLIHI